MSTRSKIEWTDFTWNPTRGCTRVSDGCRHCYAETVASRFSGPGQAYEGLIDERTRGWNGIVRCVPEALQIPWRWRTGRRIFVDSMSDLFHEAVPFRFIAAVFWIMSVTTRHTYQILTKRPDRALEFFEWACVGDFENRLYDEAHRYAEIRELAWEPRSATRGGYDNCGPGWPLENVWLGVSVENQGAANERIPLLLQAPVAVRFLSCEPLLGAIDIRAFKECAFWRDRWGNGKWLDWVIAGGESGSGARPMPPAWAHFLRNQCADSGIPFFFKQWGEFLPGETGDDGIRRTWEPYREHTPDGWEGPDRIPVKVAHGIEFGRVGKKHAGCTLDGRVHHEFPPKSRFTEVRNA